MKLQIHKKGMYASGSSDDSSKAGSSISIYSKYNSSAPRISTTRGVGKDSSDWATLGILGGNSANIYRGSTNVYRGSTVGS